jgi:ATP-dependent RNA helicase RhlE
MDEAFILTKFEALGLSTVILKTLETLGYEDPTPIQQQAIPLVLEGKDVMGLAQTGTGKTAAFGLPLIQHLNKGNFKPAPKTVRALILAPTRELARQICDNLRGFAGRTPLRIGMVVGGVSINVQIKNLTRGMDVLVATPGRLLDLVERRAVDLSTAQYLVLDEADQMLDLGFIHALRKIAKLLGTPRQTLLFSATMPKLVAELASTYLSDPVRIEVSPSGKAADKIDQSVHFISQQGKQELLKDCLIERRDDLSLVFARTKRGAERLMKHLVSCGFKAGSIHGNKSQGQRDRAIKAFKSGEIRILVATDVAARGIDISGVSHVYNYELPEVAENYVHRIGRTARAGAAGQAVAFCCPEEYHLLREIEKLMDMTLDAASGERPERAIKPAKKGKIRGGNRNQKAQGGRGRGNNGGSSEQNQGAPKKHRTKRDGAKPANNNRPGKWRNRPKRKTAA